VAKIQQAPIRQHDLTGKAHGKWDEATVAAIKKLQADQGFAQAAGVSR
jgi:hypothetical protein